MTEAPPIHDSTTLHIFSLPEGPYDARIDRTAHGCTVRRQSWSRMLCRTVPLLIVALVLCHPMDLHGAGPAKKVSLMPQWIPQAQFAGYMVAVEKGFYREAGLDMDLRTGGPGKDGLESLVAGDVTFCTAWLSEAIERRAAGVRLVNICQILQRCALLLVARKSSGFTELKDLSGEKVGFWVGEFDVPVRALFRKHKLKVSMIPNYTTLTILLKGAVDVVAAMWYNEYHTLLNSGFNADELTVFRLGDLGVDFPEDGLYCMEDTYRADPQACAALVSASLRGWMYAFEHVEETLDIVMKYAKAANTGTNRAHQRWMLARMKDLILPNGDTAVLGKLNREAFLSVGKALQSLEIVERIPRFEEFYRGK